MPQPRPLPRSLALIPGESLPGFLLRLSCRLNQPPARIAELTGLAPGRASGARMPVILLAGIPETDSSTFTRMTRLTSAQAAQLGMGTWQERYPPVIASPESKARGARRLDGRQILAPATRYCPECLAGDGSAIQKSFGGPWLKTWHLPVVFACPSTSGCWSTSAPSAARPSGDDGPAAVLPCCPRCWRPDCTPPSAARRSSRARDGTQPAAGPGSTRTASAARPAPG